MSEIRKIIEVSSGMLGNWGRFLVQTLTKDEQQYESCFNPGFTIWGKKDPSNQVLILDLITGEGAFFELNQNLEEQLLRHQIWVCVLYQPFLKWLQKFLESNTLDNLPKSVVLEEMPMELIGYRRGHLWAEEMTEELIKLLTQGLKAIGAPTPTSFLSLVKHMFPGLKIRL